MNEYDSRIRAIKEVAREYLERNAEPIIGRMFRERDKLGNIYDKHTAEPPMTAEAVGTIALRVAQEVVNSRVPSLVGPHEDTPHDMDCWLSFKAVVGKVFDESLANYERYHGKPARITRSAHAPGEPVAVAAVRETGSPWGVPPFPDPTLWRHDPDGWAAAVEDWIGGVYPGDRKRRLTALRSVMRRAHIASEKISSTLATEEGF